MNCGKRSGVLFFCAAILAFAAMTGCAKPDHPEGLAKSGGGTGPMIVFDITVKPIPEIPFPNDLATVMDEKTLTGRRLNISGEATTRLEREIRRHMDELDGFGTFETISVKFDKPVDLSTVTDGTVMLIKLLPPNQGSVIPLDLNKGFFPLVRRPESYWDFDPFKDANNIVYDPFNKEDLDGDTVPEFINFYELETNTLLLRPLKPMEESSRYAVVITRDMKGLDGQPVRSPFEYVNHTMQTADLETLPDLLIPKGIQKDQIAFCWSFTTQSISPDWLNFWNGIYNGTGPLAYINTAFPPVLEPKDLGISADMDGNRYTLNADWFEPFLAMLLPMLGQAGLMSVVDFDYIDYFSYGTFNSPTFFNNLDFGDTLVYDERYFDPAQLAGLAPAGTLHPTWMLTMPRDEDVGLDHCQSASHPHGCKDFEEAGAKGADDGFGVQGFDDNNDGAIDDEGEYMWPGSDDVADAACDNYYANASDYPVHCGCVVGGVPIPDYSTGACTGSQGNHQLDYDFGADGQPGVAGVDDDNNGVVDDITEFGWTGSDDGVTEDANGDGRLNTPPFPVVLYGHGLTMSAIESIGFVGAISRYGYALLSMDAFGHGPMEVFTNLDETVKGFLTGAGINLNEVCDTSAPSPGCNIIFMIANYLQADLNGDGVLNSDDLDGKTIDQIVSGVFNTGLLYVLSKQGRAYDVNGDGRVDSGKTFFSANILQTRDDIRQTAIDYMQLTRIVDNFGNAAHFDFNGDTVPEIDGDLDADGRVDFGGSPAVNTRGHFWMGSSLGGIHGDVNAGVNPRIKVLAPVSGAGGLTEVIPRSTEGNATRPAITQACGPIIVGTQDGPAGRVRLNFNTDPASQAFGYLYLPPNGRVRVTNLVNGETKTIDGSPNSLGVINPDVNGNFSVGIASDVGDLIEIASLDDVTGPIQSTVYVQSKYHGMGLDRNSPALRRFFGLGQMLIERGDPINVARHYFNNENGGPWPGYPEKSVLLINTMGDTLVPLNAGDNIASASGLWSLDDAKKLVNKGLHIGYVPLEGFIAPVFDPEDRDDDGLRCGFPASDPRCTPADPGIAPLPVIPIDGGKRVSAIRFHYPSETMHHAFALPGQINHGIDWGMYMVNQIGYFFQSDGSCVIDDPWELHSAPMITPGPNGVLDSVVAGDDTLHTVRILSKLGLFPCDYPFPTIQVIGTGPNFVINSTRAGDDILINYGDMYRGP